VVGKGSKERIIYLNDACRAALNDYIPLRLSEHTEGQRESALFISSRGQRISNKTVQYLVKKHLGEAGLEYRHLSTHKLRHTAATLMYQSGQVDIRVLKDILGHEQLNTTQIYTHISSESMEAAMEKNPLASLSGPGINDAKPLRDEDDSSETGSSET
jgi:site-specific recombinase XerD